MCYRPPSGDIDTFIYTITKIFHTLKVYDCYLYMGGDFNLNLLEKSKNPKVDQYFNLLVSHGLIPLISKPTRCTSQSSTLIDNIFMNNLRYSHNSYIIIDDISDHFPLFTTITNVRKNTQKQQHPARNISPNNLNKFQKACSQEDWTEILSTSSAQTAYTKMHDKINKHFHTYCPMGTKVTYQKRLPWVDNKLKLEIRKKNKLFLTYNKNPTQLNSISYKNQKRYVNKELKKAHRNYYNNKLNEYMSNPKKYWNIIKELIGRNPATAYPDYFVSEDKVICQLNEIATKFNNFFIDIGPKLADNIPQSNISFEENLTNPNLNSIYINPCDQDEVFNLFTLLKNSAPGWDELSKPVIKSILPFILPSLTHIINTSLVTGEIPVALKTARVIPLYKSENNHFFNNYRPISILPILSKILERIMHKRIGRFLEKHKILYDYQFGFRQSYSTELALTILNNKISNSLNENHITLGIFLDFSKAFDTLIFKFYYIN